MNYPKFPKFWKSQPSLNFLHELENLKTLDKAPTVSCVIPAWNEAGRITNVLKVVNAFPYFNEIVIIDDGSSDATYAEVKEFINIYDKSKRFQLLQHTKNKGKAAAVLTGSKAAKGEIIVLMDADLWDVTSENLAKMLYYVTTKQYSMTILDRASDRKGPIGMGHSFIARLLGGERAFWKKDFEKMSIPEDAGYLLEVMINNYYVEKQLPVLTIYCPNLHSYYQFQKFKSTDAWKRYLKMGKEIYGYGGAKSFYEQFTNIEEDRMGKIYRYYQKTKFKKAAVTGMIIGGAALSISTFLVLNFLEMRKKFGDTIDKIKEEADY